MQWGNKRGEKWDYKANGRVTHIIVRHRLIIDSVLFQAESSDAFTLETSDRFGGPRGHLCDKVRIHGPGEHLTTISLTIGDWGGESVIKSLSFRTNLTKYGPFGSKSETSVSIPIEGGVIVGFHGCAGNYLNAIGVHLTPKITSFGEIGGQESAPALLKTPSPMILFVQRDPGPWGAQRGRHWDDDVFLEISQVIIQTGYVDTEEIYEFNGITPRSTMIHGIQFDYEQRDGKSFISPWHGSLPGGELHKIELHSPKEIIVAIEGFYGPVKGTDGFDVITSLTIYTNMRKYGPFGENEIGTHFSSTPSGGKVVGFFGRSGTYLNAIGVHMEY